MLTVFAPRLYFERERFEPLAVAFALPVVLDAVPRDAVVSAAGFVVERVVDVVVRLPISAAPLPVVPIGLIDPIEHRSSCA